MVCRKTGIISGTEAQKWMTINSRKWFKYKSSVHIWIKRREEKKESRAIAQLVLHPSSAWTGCQLDPGNICLLIFRTEWRIQSDAGWLRLRGLTAEPSRRWNSCADVFIPQLSGSTDKMRWTSGLLGIGGIWEFVSRAVVKPAAVSQTAVLGDSAEMLRRPWTQQSRFQRWVTVLDALFSQCLHYKRTMVDATPCHFRGFANGREMKVYSPVLHLNVHLSLLLKPRLSWTRENWSPTSENYNIQIDSVPVGWATVTVLPLSRFYRH